MKKHNRKIICKVIKMKPFLTLNREQKPTLELQVQFSHSLKLMSESIECQKIECTLSHKNWQIESPKMNGKVNWNEKERPYTQR